MAKKIINDNGSWHFLKVSKEERELLIHPLVIIKVEVV